MNAERISLLNNPVTVIPDNLLQTGATQLLSFARTQIQALPASLGQLDQLQMLFIDYTNVSELPPWLIIEGQRRADA